MKTNPLFFAVVFLCAAITSQAQNAAPFKIEAYAGIGLLPTFVKDRSQNLHIPMSALVSYRISGIFSVDAFGGYSASQATRISSITGAAVQFEHRYSFAGLRVAAHTNPYRFDRLDLYGGMSGMYTLSEISRRPAVKSSVEDGLPFELTKGKFCATAFLGARYALTKRWGIWGELGFGAAIVNAGISHRFVRKKRK